MDMNIDIPIDMGLILAMDYYKKMGQAFKLDPTTYFTSEQLAEVWPKKMEVEGTGSKGKQMSQAGFF